MTAAEKLAQQRGGRGNAPKLNLQLEVGMSKHPEGGSSFKYWDKNKGEKGENVFFKNPITGFLIGSGLKAYSYDKPNRTMYSSAVYFSNKKITIFKPKETGVLISGSKEDIVMYFAQNNLPTRLSVKQVLYIATLTKSGSSFIEVETNIGIAISQQQAYRSGLESNLITLTPTLYDPSDTNIADDVHKRLDLDDPKMYPTYANISIGEIVTEEQYDTLQILERDAAFREFKKYYSVNEASSEEDENKKEESKEETSLPPSSHKTQPEADDTPSNDLNDLIEGDDDLPF